MEQIEKALGKKITRIETNDLDEMEEVSILVIGCRMRSKTLFVENEASTQIVAVVLLHFLIVNNRICAYGNVVVMLLNHQMKTKFYSSIILQLSTNAMLSNISTGQLTKANLDKLGQKR